MRALGITRLVLGLVLAVIAGATFHRVFATGDLIKPVVIGLACGALVPLALALGGRLHPLLTAGVSAFAFVVASGAVLFSNPVAIGDVVGSMIDGWDGILTTTLPARGRAEILIVVAIVVWIAALSASVAALSGAGPLGIVAGPTVGLLLGIAMTAGGPGSNVGLTVGFLCVVGAIFALAAVPQRLGLDRDDAGGLRSAARDPDHRGMLLTPVAVVAAVIVIAAALGPVLPGASDSDPTVLRREPPTQELDAANPITLVSPSLRLPASSAPDAPVGDCVLATVRRTDGRALGDRLRIAALDRYDGITWATGTTFRRADTTIPAPPPQAPDAEAKAGSSVSYRITIDRSTALFGDASTPAECGWPWPDAGFLPTFDRATSVEACDDSETDLELVYDPDSGNVASGLPVAGLTYCATSSLTIPGAAKGNAITDAGTYIQLPAELPPGIEDGPQTILDISTIAGTAPETATEKLKVLNQFFTNPASYVRVPDNLARSGEDLGTLQAFFNPIKTTSTKAPGGSYEQYAALFAVSARRLGLPARVVVGFDLGGSAGSRQVDLLAKDLRVWPEVAFPNQGWVAFEPFPEVGDPATQPEPEPPTPEEDANTDPNSPSVERIETRAVEDTGAGGLSTGAVILTLLGIAVVLGLLAVPSIVLLKRRRARQRHLEADPRRRTIGAWHETLDRLHDHRVDRLDALSAAEVAQAVGEIGPESRAAVEPLGGLANQALFDPRDPSEEVAENAWVLAGAIRRGIASERDLRTRVRAALSLRSLRRRAGAGRR